MKREKVPLITDDDQTSQEQLTSPLKEKKKKQKKNVFSKLNADVILSIFKHFTFKEMTTLALVCKQWRDITTRDEVKKKKKFPQILQFLDSLFEFWCFGNVWENENALNHLSIQCF